MADKLYIGVMSGTSMDGIDTVLASISENKTTSIESFSAPFSSSLKSKLQSLSLPGDNEIDRLGEASVELGEAIAETV
ncbi:anhydro-N-acetylmuramic acid kinase, partial [Oleiphilus sp. HI0086]